MIHQKRLTWRAARDESRTEPHADGLWLNAVLYVLLVGFSLPLAIGCQHEDADRSAVLRGRAMGTTWMVRFSAPLTASEQARVRRNIAATIELVEAEMSTWRKDSALSEINRTQSIEPIPISAELAEVLAEAIDIQELTNGAFDVGAGRLVELWGFGPQGDKTRSVSAAEVDHEKKLLESDQLEVEQGDSGWRLRKLRPSLQLDLSAIAKGYAIDCVAAQLDKQQIDGYLIELGGELRSKGTNRDSKGWTIGLEEPERAGIGQVRRVVELVDKAIATSGSYRNFSLDNSGTSEMRNHLVDPRTGRTTDHALVSVSVIADTAMRADALATGLFILGPERGFALAEREGIAATFVWREGELQREKQTSSFPALVERKR